MVHLDQAAQVVDGDIYIVTIEFQICCSPLTFAS
jgi:hypothetical protein